MYKERHYRKLEIWKILISIHSLKHQEIFMFSPCAPRHWSLPFWWVYVHRDQRHRNPDAWSSMRFNDGTPLRHHRLDFTGKHAKNEGVWFWKYRGVGTFLGWKKTPSFFGGKETRNKNSLRISSWSFPIWLLWMFLNLLSKVGQPKPVDETSEKGLRVVVEAETWRLVHDGIYHEPCYQVSRPIALEG